MLAVTACPNGITHTYMAAEALTKMGDKLGLPTKIETNGSDGAKNVLTPEEIAACDGIIIAADKNVETARFDGKPVLFARVDDGIHKPEELIKKIAHGETPIYHAEAGAKTRQAAGGANDSFGHSLYKHLMNGVSHMQPFVVGGGSMIALAGSLSMVFGCALRTPHGGIFVFPVVDHALLYVVALIVGSVVGAVILSLLKKEYVEE